MEKELNEIKKQLTARIHLVFQQNFNGNKTLFARTVGCDEKAIRLLFDFGQGMSLNLLLKIARAIGKTPSELLDGLALPQDVDVPQPDKRKVKKKN
ncbi:hypothetical protein [Sphingobacterium siyangense]|uniref:hypothetical protein n=1 Tax=Sphingobacterium siyangense TaxID=459529 RepID=UPI0019659B96|nr:hypothetical protein [Sphingobacterium siyangense]QRY55554.1 hypothetical protein JVX97_16055 [Sphingobacterium siyangense]